jgi:ABC-type transport system involved in multi-copper enzyme maturation permease subunit
MLRALGVVTMQTFILLRRDRIFWPALGASLLISAVAALFSSWGTEDLVKMRYDFGLFGFQLSGSAVAMLWGVKMISDARQDGSMEVQLAAPVSRGVWLVGKYLGLGACILLISSLFMTVWQAMLLALGYNLMQGPQLLAFAMMVLGWMVTGALAVFFASLARAPLAIFATVSTWIAGLISPLVGQATTHDTPLPIRLVVATITRYWDLQQFNLVDKALDPAMPSLRFILDGGLYGIILIALLISLASIICSRRDALPA